MKVIGITGPTGAGKTTALNALRSLGGQIIDADAVFQDQKALADLNAITHKYVAQETARRIAAARQAGVPAVGIDAIALLESPLAAYCDRTLAITAPEELRVKRIMAREGISEDYARMRVAAQKPSAWFQAHCDDTLESTETDTVETFAQRARALFQQMLEESK